MPCVKKCQNQNARILFYHFLTPLIFVRAVFSPQYKQNPRYCCGFAYIGGRSNNTDKCVLAKKREKHAFNSFYLKHRAIIVVSRANVRAMPFAPCAICIAPRYWLGLVLCWQSCAEIPPDPLGGSSASLLLPSLARLR